MTDPFYPHWPEGLKANESYGFQCDDKRHNQEANFRLIVSEDGDVWFTMNEWEDIGADEKYYTPFPSMRCRTGMGGGRNHRTHQALLWLAQAIRLDNEENNR